MTFQKTNCKRVARLSSSAASHLADAFHPRACTTLSSFGFSFNAAD